MERSIFWFYSFYATLYFLMWFGFMYMKLPGRFNWLDKNNNVQGLLQVIRYKHIIRHGLVYWYYLHIYVFVASVVCAETSSQTGVGFVVFIRGLEYDDMYVMVLKNYFLATRNKMKSWQLTLLFLVESVQRIIATYKIVLFWFLRIA